MSNLQIILFGILVVMICIYVIWLKKEAKKEKEAKEKKQKVRDEAKRLSLEKHKDIYEKAIREIEELILDLPKKEYCLRYDCGKIPVFVVEAIAEHFTDKGWSVGWRTDSIEIYISK